MKARITVLTIGVGDLIKSLKFYRDGLGLKTEALWTRPGRPPVGNSLDPGMGNQGIKLFTE